MSEDKKLFAVTQLALKAVLVAIPVIFVGLTFIFTVFAISPSFRDGSTITSRFADTLTSDWGVAVSAAEARIFGLLIYGVCVVALSLVGLILRAILRIVVSATGDDPFVAKNAADLARIGGLMLVLYALEFGAGLGIIGMFPGVTNTPIGGPFSLGDILYYPMNLLTVLLIFVLARIFKRGAEMRADLESTV